MLLVMKSPSPAVVISSLALLVALGGTSYAALQLPRNSVGTPQLQASAVTSAKIRDGSVRLKDMAPAALGNAMVLTGDETVGPLEISTITQVMATSPPTAGMSEQSSAGTMILRVRSRVNAMATVEMYKPGSAATRTASANCLLQHAPARTNNWQAVAASKTVTFEPVPQPNWAVFRTLTLAGWVNFDPGQYDFRVVCSSAQGNNNVPVTFESGSLVATAAPRR